MRVEHVRVAVHEAPLSIIYLQPAVSYQSLVFEELELIPVLLTLESWFQGSMNQKAKTIHIYISN